MIASTQHAWLVATYSMQGRIPDHGDAAVKPVKEVHMSTLVTAACADFVVLGEKPDQGAE